MGVPESLRCDELLVPNCNQRWRFYLVSFLKMRPILILGSHRIFSWKRTWVGMKKEEGRSVMKLVDIGQIFGKLYHVRQADFTSSEK
jgi:hypothetical protein